MQWSKINAQVRVGMDDEDGREPKMSETLLTVREIASHLRLKPSWVYEHADELGAYRLGKYLRFALPRVMERLERGRIGGPDVGSATQRPPSTPTKGDGSNEQGTE